MEQIETLRREIQDKEADRMKDEKLQRCIAYFKERPIYRKLFEKVREKYAILGHLGGTVVLTGLTDEDRRQLGGFFQKDFAEKKTITISYTAMEKALENSRFAGLKWEEILKGYLGEELIAKKEQKLAWQEARQRYFMEILTEFPANPGSMWLEETLQTQGEGYLLLIKQYKETPEQLRESLRHFLEAVPQLPLFKASHEQMKMELLPVFAAVTTGDPHFFDAGMPGEQLLVAFLKSRISNSMGKTAFRAEEKAELFYEAGLLKDDLSNHTLVYGIHAWTKDGKPHEGIGGFVSQKEPVILTLLTLGSLAGVSTQEEKSVYIVENPAVFSTLVRAWPDAAIICGNGQVRLATLVLLDLFEEETPFFYAGDFDPEGLVIAQRLKERYGERLHLWNYQRKYYEECCSDVAISEKSLKKLEKIHVPELQEIREALQQEKKAAYQEAMLKAYLQGRPKAWE